MPIFQNVDLKSLVHVRQIACSAKGTIHLETETSILCFKEETKSSFPFNVQAVSFVAKLMEVITGKKFVGIEADENKIIFVTEDYKKQIEQGIR